MDELLWKAIRTVDPYILFCLSFAVSWTFLPPRSISLPASATVLQPARTTNTEDIKNAKSVFMVCSRSQEIGCGPCNPCRSVFSPDCENIICPGDGAILSDGTD